jgi:glycosyltransferase involved in cell wall biosynthesis
MMLPKGGSEIIKDQLVSLLPEGSLDGINLITSICHPDLIQKDKINIVWQQLSYDQPNVQYMKDRKFVDSVDYFVYNSHWVFEKFRTYFKIPEYKSFVIKNSTHTFDKIEKNNERLKLIYTSTPWRGLGVLIRAIEKLNKTRDDFTLDVYSSTKIYGDKFEELEGDKFKPLFDMCKNTKNVNYIGYGTNEEIRKALETTDILTYPSIFEETSCIAAIEAMMAGCHVVTTNYGALPETCSEFATMIEFNPTLDLVNSYADALSNVMDNYKAGVYKEDTQLQTQFYKKFYSWETRIEEWKGFLNYVRSNKEKR